LACSNEIPLLALDGLVLVECTECASLNKLKQQCAAVGMTFKVPYIVDSYEQAQHFAAGGLGIIMVPEGLPLFPSLVSRRIANVKVSRSVVFAVVSGRRYSTALNAFVRLIRARDFSPSSMDIAG
jgi:DNA-binding transcriptional LysR family regulator